MEIINSYKCEVCNYTTNTKTNLGIHCKSKKHCHLAGIPYEPKTVTKEIYTDVMEDVTKYNEMKKFDMDLQADTFMKEINKLKEQLQRQEEANSIKEQMNALKYEVELLKEKIIFKDCIIADKDKMIDYLMNKEVPIQVIQPIQVAPQVAPQPIQVAPQVAPQVKAKEDPDDVVLNKSYLQKYCMMDSVNFSKNIEIIQDDYELFMTGDYVPMKQVMTQILERELKRITLHEMGVVVLPNEKIYTYIDEWTESSKGIHDIRNWISKQLQLFLIEDETYEGMEHVTDEEYEGQKPTNKQAEQYTDVTKVILQLQNERHEIDKEIKLILQKYSTK